MTDRAPARHVLFLFLRRPDDLKKEEQETRLYLRQSHPALGLTDDLVQECATMLRTRTGDNRDPWLVKAVARQIPVFQSVVLRMEREKAAVRAGLTRPESHDLGEEYEKLTLTTRMGMAGLDSLCSVSMRFMLWNGQFLAPSRSESGSLI